VSGLVIVGRYPFADRRLEGMVQRIANIDTQLADTPRTYLDLYVLKRIKSSSTRIGQTQIYTASFLHFWSILRILRQAKEVYIHSIYFYALIFLPLLFTSRQVRLILDVHGAVPEEIHHTGNRQLARLMSWVEREAFSRIQLAVCVTRRMERFYLEKYPETTAKFLYLPIFTSQVCGPADPLKVNALRTKLGIPESAIVYLYSGGLQPWQNIDRMLDTSRKLLDSNDVWIIFLTGEEQALAAIIEQTFGYIPEHVVIAHARPDDLRNYYSIANFGFILREAHVLNRVANPTKLVEYLYFGMRPIVWSSDIGDFLDMGYEYVSLESLESTSVPQSKSYINHGVSQRLLEDAASANISNYLG
jgi:hypothetical protein